MRKAGGKEKREEEMMMEQQELLLLGSRNTHHNPLFNSCPLLSPSSKEMRMTAKEIGIFFPPTSNQKENQVDAHKSLQSFEIKSAAARISPSRGILQEMQSTQHGNRCSLEQVGLRREVSLTPSKETEVAARTSQSFPDLVSVMELQMRIKDILEEEAGGGGDSEMGDGELDSISWGCERSDTGTTDARDEVKAESLPYHPKLNLLSPRPQFLRYRPNRRLELLCKSNAEAEGIHHLSEVFPEQNLNNFPVHLDFSENRSNLSVAAAAAAAAASIEPNAAEIQEKLGCFRGDEKTERSGNASIAGDTEQNSWQIESVDHVKEAEARIDEYLGRESNLEREKGNKFSRFSASTTWILRGLCFLLLGYALQYLLLRSLSFGILPKQEHSMPSPLLNEQTLRIHRLSKPLLRRELSILLKGWVAGGEVGFPAQALVKNASELLKIILTVHAEHVSRNQSATFLPQEMDRMDQNSEALVSTYHKNASAQFDGLSTRQKKEKALVGLVEMMDQEVGRETHLSMDNLDQSLQFDGLSTRQNMEKSVVGLVKMDQEVGRETHLSMDNLDQSLQFDGLSTRQNMEKALVGLVEMMDQEVGRETHLSIDNSGQSLQFDGFSTKQNMEKAVVGLVEMDQEVGRETHLSMDNSDQSLQFDGLSTRQNMEKAVVALAETDQELGREIHHPIDNSDQSLFVSNHIGHLEKLNPAALKKIQLGVTNPDMKSLDNKENHSYYGSKPLALIAFSTLLSLLALFLLLSKIMKNPSALQFASSINMPSRDVGLHTSQVKQALQKESSSTKRISSAFKKQVSSSEDHLIVSPKRDQVSPFGSFTDYKVVYVNEGMEGEQVHLTPVRRSSRIRNKMQSPSDQIR